jgi:hypothetical protein
VSPSEFLPGKLLKSLQTASNVIPDETESRSGIQETVLSFWIPDSRFALSGMTDLMLSRRQFMKYPGQRI